MKPYHNEVIDGVLTLTEKETEWFLQDDGEYLDCVKDYLLYIYMPEKEVEKVEVFNHLGEKVRDFYAYYRMEENLIEGLNYRK